MCYIVSQILRALHARGLRDTITIPNAHVLTDLDPKTYWLLEMHYSLATVNLYKQLT